VDEPVGVAVALVGMIVVVVRGIVLIPATLRQGLRSPQTRSEVAVRSRVGVAVQTRAVAMKVGSGVAWIINGYSFPTMQMNRCRAETHSVSTACPSWAKSSHGREYGSPGNTVATLARIGVLDG
jgi:hypothetical protein